MAIEFITAVWRMSPYKAEKLLVQLACADWANESGEFYPSFREIALKARITKPGAVKIIGQMIEDGEIVLTSHGHGRGNANRYQFADFYIEAVREIRDSWDEKRLAKKVNEKQEKVNAVDLLGRAEKVNENIKKVNEKREKVNENGHVRNNRHEPSREPSGTSPVIDDLGTILEEMYPGHATNFRTMRELADLVIRLKAATEDVRRFPEWLSKNHPMKANTPFSFKDLFHESIRKTSTATSRQSSSQAPDWYKEMYESVG